MTATAVYTVWIQAFRELTRPTCGKYFTRTKLRRDGIPAQPDALLPPWQAPARKPDRYANMTATGSHGRIPAGEALDAAQEEPPAARLHAPRGGSLRHQRLRSAYRLLALVLARTHVNVIAARCAIDDSVILVEIDVIADAQIDGTGRVP